jgi:hypothetical protein
MFMAQRLRQRDFNAAAGQPNARLTGGKGADPADPRPRW